MPVAPCPQVVESRAKGDPLLIELVLVHLIVGTNWADCAGTRTGDAARPDQFIRRQFLLHPKQIFALFLELPADASQYQA